MTFPSINAALYSVDEHDPTDLDSENVARIRDDCIKSDFIVVFIRFLGVSARMVVLQKTEMPVLDCRFSRNGKLETLVFFSSLRASIVG